MSTFAELGASPSVCAALKRRDIATAFPIQELVMRDALAGRDVLARSRTGSGKTLAFGVPMVEQLDPLDRRPVGLVLVPTRELATQVSDEISDIAAAQGMRVSAVYGGVGIREQARAAARSHIVVATPGRLTDLVERRLLSLDRIKILVLDEADRMLDMGFQPQVNRIVSMIPKDRQTMFFSATLDGEVGRLARAYTREAVLHEIESVMQTVDEAEHRFLPVTREDKLSTLVKVLEQESGTTLVFVRTKRGADRLTYNLKARGIQALAMHGDLTQPARRRALDKFASGRVNVLVATDVAARGLDLDLITHVVNYDPPEDHKAYVHRVGRTARAGRSGIGTTLVMPDQRPDMSRIAANLKLQDEFTVNGMTISPPRNVYQSHKGRRSMMRPRPARRI